jgi:non-specific serine/threonine protein kinase
VDGVLGVAGGDPIPPDDVLDGLDALVSASILNRDPGEGTARYSMLQTVREYGLELLRKSGAERAQRLRHRDWVADCVGEADVLAGAHQPRWLDLMQREHDNLRAALDFCLKEAESAEIGLLMAAQCWLYWIARGHLGEARRWLTALLEVAPGPSRARVRALATLAMVDMSVGDARAADAALDEGSQLCRSMLYEDAAPFYTLLTGISAYMQLDFGRAAALFAEAKDAFTSMRDERWLAYTWTQLAAVRGILGEPAESQALFEQSRAVAAQLGDAWLIARATLTEGALLTHRDDAARASALLQESIRASVAIGERWVIAAAVEKLATVAVTESRWERAAHLLGASEALWETAPPALSDAWVGLREKTRAEARQRLGDSAFDAAITVGRGMSLELVVRLSLEQSEVVPSAVRVRPSASPLSARELEVAALIAQGLSNKEIASRLIIAERTVDTHVNHILTRLGFNSRVQLAAWHVEQARSVPGT